MLQWHGAAHAADDTDQGLLERAQALFKPLPADASTPQRPVTPDLVALGQALFFEPRVSGDGKVSCGGCHLPSFYGAEPLPQTVGFQGKVLPRNTPTVFNTALQFVQHYGGNRVDVEEQAVKALVSPFAYAIRITRRQKRGCGRCRATARCSRKLSRASRAGDGGELGQGDRRLRARAAHAGAVRPLS